MKIRNAMNPFGSGTKRFHVPGARIEIECEKCKRPLVLDLGDDYLSYPHFNQPEEVTLECERCEYHPTTKRIVLRLVIEAAP